MVPGLYMAEHIDPEKFEAELNSLKRYQDEVERTAVEKARAFHAGYTACLDAVSSMLHCSNYESEQKITAAYREGANNAFYELCKELDVDWRDVREKNISVDEKAALIAERIRDFFRSVDRSE